MTYYLQQFIIKVFLFLQLTVVYIWRLFLVVGLSLRYSFFHSLCHSFFYSFCHPLFHSFPFSIADEGLFYPDGIPEFVVSPELCVTVG